MPDMKHFLEPNSTFRKTIMLAVPVICVIFIFVFGGFIISDGGPLMFVMMPAMPFLLMAAFCIFVYRRGNSVYPNWWNSLTDAEREDIERDYRNAEPFDGFLILGNEYAFINHIGRAIRYDEIDNLHFTRAKGGWNMFVELQNGRKLVSQMPRFANRRNVWEVLMQRCGKDVEVSNGFFDFF